MPNLKIVPSIYSGYVESELDEHKKKLEKEYLDSSIIIVRQNLEEEYNKKYDEMEKKYNEKNKELEIYKGKIFFIFYFLYEVFEKVVKIFDKKLLLSCELKNKESVLEKPLELNTTVALPTGFIESSIKPDPITTISISNNNDEASLKKIIDYININKHLLNLNEIPKNQTTYINTNSEIEHISKMLGFKDELKKNKYDKLEINKRHDELEKKHQELEKKIKLAFNQIKFLTENLYKLIKKNKYENENKNEYELEREKEYEKEMDKYGGGSNETADKKEITEKKNEEEKEEGYEILA